MATWKQHEALRSVYTVFAGIRNFSTPRPRKWFGTNQAYFIESIIDCLIIAK